MRVCCGVRPLHLKQRGVIYGCYRALLTSSSALRFELRQVRGGCLDLSLIQRRCDSSHGARRGLLSLGACLEFVEPIDDELRGFSRDARKANTVAFAMRAMTAEASPHLRGALFGELLSREHTHGCGRNARSEPRHALTGKVVLSCSRRRGAPKGEGGIEHAG